MLRVSLEGPQETTPGGAIIRSVSLKLPEVLTIVTFHVTITLSPPVKVDTAGLSRMTTLSFQYLLCEIYSVAPFEKLARLAWIVIL